MQNSQNNTVSLFLNKFTHACKKFCLSIKQYFHVTIFKYFNSVVVFNSQSRYNFVINLYILKFRYIYVLLNIFTIICSNASDLLFWILFFSLSEVYLLESILVKTQVQLIFILSLFLKNNFPGYTLKAIFTLHGEICLFCLQAPIVAIGNFAVGSVFSDDQRVSNIQSINNQSRMYTLTNLKIA